MANPFVPPTISGYNASPPSDDGANTDANEVTWAKHKTKLADPIKTWLDTTLTNLTTAFDRTWPHNGVETASATASITAGQRGTHFEASNTITLNLLAAGTATDGFMISVRNGGSGIVTIDPDGSETINGAATLAVAAGDSVLVVCDGSNWFAMGITGNAARTDTANTFTEDQTIDTSGAVATMTVRSDQGDDTDDVGQLDLAGEDDGDNDTIYGRIKATILDNTDTTEDGTLDFMTMLAGTLTSRMQLQDGLFMAGATGGDQGSGTGNFSEVYKNGTSFTSIMGGFVFIAAGPGDSGTFTLPSGVASMDVFYILQGGGGGGAGNLNSEPGGDGGDTTFSAASGTITVEGGEGGDRDSTQNPPTTTNTDLEWIPVDINGGVTGGLAAWSTAPTGAGVNVDGQSYGDGGGPNIDNGGEAGAMGAGVVTISANTAYSVGSAGSAGDVDAGAGAGGFAILLGVPKTFS